MPKKNRYGLLRNIPEPIKRQVRQACGFGCVVCGASIIEYEHVDPPFADATEHDPERITLLCPQCHAKVTRGFMSKETVKEAMSTPLCKKRGYSSELLDVGRYEPVIVIGGVKTYACPIPVAVRGIPLFKIEAAEESGGPVRVSANFHNSRGNPSLLITDNEWRAFGSNWDVEASGGAITIRDKKDHVSLRLVVVPPQEVIVEKLDMYLAGFRLIGDPDILTVVSPSGHRQPLTGCIAHSCMIGLLIN